MWSGLSVLNWHVLKLHSHATDANAALGRTSDNAQNRGQQRAEVAASGSADSDTQTGCEVIERTEGELGGTVVSAIVGMAVVSVCRLALQYAVWCIQVPTQHLLRAASSPRPDRVHCANRTRKRFRAETTRLRFRAGNSGFSSRSLSALPSQVCVFVFFVCGHAGLRVGANAHRELVKAAVMSARMI